MTATLGQFQQQFAQALLASPKNASPALQALTNQPAFAVYRNTVMKACIDALEANFPAVARLVGADWFRAAAALYVAQELPGDARLLHYGHSFVDFLRNFEPAKALVYLPGVASLDIAWRESHVALNAACANAAWVARQSPEQLATLMLQPHPAARWAWFDAQPIYSIWSQNRTHQPPSDQDASPTWQPEGALLTRPDDTVTWHPLSRAGCLLLDACAQGMPLAQAADQALSAEPEADIAGLFAMLLSAGAFATTASSPAHPKSP